MLRKLFFAGIFLLTYHGSFAQGKETRQLPPFTGITISSIAKVHLRQDPIQSVQVVSNGISSTVETNVSNNTLHIEGGPNTELYIALPAIEKIDISGRGEVIGESLLTGDHLNLNISGDGKVTMNVAMKNIKADIGGLGKIVLSGSSDNADISISGSGKIDAMDLKVVTCHAAISGLGKCMIDVTDELDADISGSGTITYKNAPKNIQRNVSGIGKILEEGSTSTTSRRDTTHFTLGTTDVYIVGKNDSMKINVEKKSKPIWGGVELGMNSWVNADRQFGVPAGYNGLELRQEKSMSIALNVLQKDFQFGHSNLWFTTGLGVTWNNYRFQNNISVNPTTPITTTADTASNLKYVKSKLVASYLMAPLMFEVFTSKNPKKAFHIGAGALVGLRLGSHTKQKYEDNGKVYKPKTYDDFNLNPFRYGARVALGYHHFNVFADYYMSTLFKDKKGPTLYPVNVGITLAGF